jgi:RND family efflux transporter MFP subunit
MIQQILVPLVSVIVGAIAVVALLWWLIGRFVKNSTVKGLLRTAILTTPVIAFIVFAPNLRPEPGQFGQGSAGSTVDQSAEPIDSYTVQEETFTTTLAATGNLEAGQQRDLDFEGYATVAQVYVDTGSYVEEGDLLAELDTVDLEESLWSAEIALNQAQNDYSELIAPPTDLDIALAEAAIDVAQGSLYAAYDTAPTNNDEEIARIETELARNSLYQQQLNRDITQETNPEFRGDATASDLVTESNLESAELNVQIQDIEYSATVSDTANVGSVTSAQASLLQAETDLLELTNGPDELDIQRLNIDVQNAELEIMRLETQLSQMQIVAPFSGVVAEENLTPGELPPTSSSAITLVDTSAYVIDLQIDETDIVDVRVGQRVELVVDAFPGQVFSGTITDVNESPVEQGQLVTYFAEATLDPTDLPLRIGMNVTANIVLSEKPDAIVVPNRFIQFDGDTANPTVIIQDPDGSFRRVEVLVGSRNTAESEIVGGLAPGTTIVQLPQVEETTGSGGFPPRPGGN